MEAAGILELPALSVKPSTATRASGCGAQRQTAPHDDGNAGVRLVPSVFQRSSLDRSRCGLRIVHIRARCIEIHAGGQIWAISPPWDSRACSASLWHGHISRRRSIRCRRCSKLDLVMPQLRACHDRRMPAVRMVKMPAHEVVHVIAVRNRLVAAARAMCVSGLMPAAFVIRCAASWVRRGDCDRVIVDVAIVHMMQVPVVQIVGMAVKLDGGVAAFGDMCVGMTLVVIQGVAIISPPNHLRIARFVHMAMMRSRGETLQIMSVRRITCDNNRSQRSGRSMPQSGHLREKTDRLSVEVDRNTSRSPGFSRTTICGPEPSH